MRKTKIICTLGPSTDDPNVMKDLILSGMNVARFNFSHGTHEDHLKRLNLVKKTRDELGVFVATMLDTKGPEIRIGRFKDGSIMLNEGDKFTITTREVEGNEREVSVLYKDFPKDVKVGTRVLLSDGLIEMVVDDIDGEDVHLTVKNKGKLSNNKSINLPEVKLSMPFVSEKDRQDIIFGIENDFDFIALSFTRCKEDVLEVRKILEEHNCTSMRIIAKIENGEGVDKIDEILDVVDAIMVARGDMGVEIDFTKIPKIQKELISKCYNSGKPAITATQMLESMTENPRPTRAEVTDVANAIYDGTSAIMLSGETAAGKYPVKAVQTMAAIAEATENSIDYDAELRARKYGHSLSITESISHAACSTAMDIDAKAIVTVTKTGFTARNLSKYRPNMPIIGCSDTEKSCRQLALSWGVVPLLMKSVTSTDELIELSIAAAVKENLIKEGDMVVVTAGVPVGVAGSTNIIKAQEVGKICLGNLKL
ncbi:MAG: pyruvate kinase [Oscillospiraceae bacterium]|nr:pyruvate kinase [Oscillospiraceae bacterium]